MRWKNCLKQAGLAGSLQTRYGRTPSGLEVKEVFEREEMQSYAETLGDLNNISMFGMGAFLESANRMKKQVLLDNHNVLENIFQVYGEWKNRFVEGIWNGFGKGGALTGNSRVELAAFCKYILEN